MVKDKRAPIISLPEVPIPENRDCPVTSIAEARHCQYLIRGAEVRECSINHPIGQRTGMPQCRWLMDVLHISLEQYAFSTQGGVRIGCPCKGSEERLVIRRKKD